MVSIASRASWGARYRDGDIGLSGLAQAVFLHHTVTTQLPANATVAQERVQMRNLEQIGQSRFGQGISYNVLIFPSGRAYQGVSFNRRGAHTDLRNSTVRSICFVGNYSTAQPTAAQLETAAKILAEGYGKWWVNSAPVYGHRSIKATQCPGNHLFPRLASIRARSLAIKATPVTKPKPAPAKTRKPHRIAALSRTRNQRTWRARLWQRFLVEQGIRVVVDQSFGPATEAATKVWQRQRGLPQTGRVERHEWFEACRNTFPTTTRKAQVEIFQRMLGFLGRAVDGSNGPLTQGRTIEVQRWLGVAPDRHFGPISTNALIKKG